MILESRTDALSDALEAAAVRVVDLAALEHGLRLPCEAKGAHNGG